jgi:hypothetical protein
MTPVDERLDALRHSSRQGPTHRSSSNLEREHMTQIIAVVTYRLPDGTDRDTAVQMFRDSIPRYMSTPGLLRKNVLYDEGTGGGVYLWESRQAAEKAYSDEWVAYMTDKYNHPPEIQLFESPITMDQQHNAVYDERDLSEAAE